MCIVSAVTDHYSRQWDQLPQSLPGTLHPFNQLQGKYITWVEWQEYQELKLKAAEIDKALGTPDCEDPAKQEWEKKALEWLEKNVRKT